MVDVTRNLFTQSSVYGSPPFGGLERGTERLRDLQMIVQWEGVIESQITAQYLS